MSPEAPQAAPEGPISSQIDVQSEVVSVAVLDGNARDLEALQDFVPELYRFLEHPPDCAHGPALRARSLGAPCTCGLGRALERLVALGCRRPQYREGPIEPAPDRAWAAVELAAAVGGFVGGLAGSLVSRARDERVRSELARALPAHGAPRAAFDAGEKNRAPAKKNRAPAKKNRAPAKKNRARPR